MEYPEKDKERIKLERKFMELLNRIGKIAEGNGLTEEILNALLNKED